ncbi:MAG: RdgB/HAM1 family non-canonical purine NTP pyrophosphatase, partial [bacterium]
FATHNQNKCNEIDAMVGDKFEIQTLDNVGITEEIPEDGDTFKANALIKAKYVYDKLNCDCFADDSGLMVDALGGEPGIYSARYAGEPCDMKRNIEKLLAKLEGVKNRKAKFHTSIALIIDGEIKYFEGEIYGVIIDELRGDNGFGYDPIFVPDGYDKTFAELDSEIKNAISHRAVAVKKLTTYLKGNF